MLSATYQLQQRHDEQNFSTRRRQPPALAHEPPPARRRGLARRDAGGLRQARPHARRPDDRPVAAIDNRRRTVYAKVSRHELNGCCACSTSPTPTSPASAAPRRRCRSSSCSCSTARSSIEQAKALAARMQTRVRRTTPRKMQRAYRLAYGRGRAPRKSAKPSDLPGWQRRPGRTIDATD